MKTHERITVNPDVMVGKPVIKGTRVTVESILRKLGTGWDVAQILDAHPHLKAEDVYAAVQYAADVLEQVDSERNLHLDVLRQALIDGEKSGSAVKFDVEVFLKLVKG